MSGCMETDKPLISILMAVYEPRMDWLKEQLDSLNAQTYPNLQLYVRDDCSPTVPFADIQAMVAACITNFPYTIQRNERNLGSNLTFEQLTREAEGECFAYCDQDDIWLPEKLGILERTMEESGAALVCSDMYVIDSNGEKIADSITSVRRHHHFYSGEHVADKLLIRNFVTGCTMLVNAKIAKHAIPFCPYMVHDHYLALFCASRGFLLSVMEPLIYYRIHSGNQTGIMIGVVDKVSYQIQRIQLISNRLQWLKSYFLCDDSLKQDIEDAILWVNARLSNWTTGHGMLQMWKYRKFGSAVTMFEIIFSKLPERVFLAVIWLLRTNRL